MFHSFFNEFISDMNEFISDMLVCLVNLAMESILYIDKFIEDEHCLKRLS